MGGVTVSMASISHEGGNVQPRYQSFSFAYHRFGYSHTYQVDVIGCDELGNVFGWLLWREEQACLQLQRGEICHVFLHSEENEYAMIMGDCNYTAG